MLPPSQKVGIVNYFNQHRYMLNRGREQHQLNAGQALFCFWSFSINSNKRNEERNFKWACSYFLTIILLMMTCMENIKQKSKNCSLRKTFVNVSNFLIDVYTINFLYSDINSWFFCSFFFFVLNSTELRTLMGWA
jgi:hypothetical protein